MRVDTLTTEFPSYTDSLLGLKPGEALVGPQAFSFDFYAVYQTKGTFVPFPENQSFQLAISEGESDYAPFGLTNLTASGYITLPDQEGNFSFSGNPEDFRNLGLQTEEVRGDTFFGSGINKLFGVSSGSGSIDFNNGIVSGAGTITITGGQGLLQGASGTLTFTETVSLADATGTATVTGGITVPLPFASCFLAGL